MIGGSRPTVLVVDDEELVRSILVSTLEEDFSVLTAPDAQSALALLTRMAADIVLLDLRLPGMNGLDLLDVLRSRYPQSRVVVLSAITEVDTVVKAVKLGAHDYVTKPWRSDDLLRTLHRVAGPRTLPFVLLAGEELGTLTVVEVLLERYVRALAIAPEAAALWRLNERVVPDLTVLVSGRRTHHHADFVRALHTFYPQCALLWVTAEADAATAITVAPLSPGLRLVVTSCPLDDMLGAVAALLEATGHAFGPWPRVSATTVKALRYLAEHFRMPLTVADVAHAGGLSPDRFAHLFRAEMGTAVKEYVARFRIALGRRLLRETDRKIDDIAEFVGLGDASHFSRVFNAHSGMRPGQYRRLATDTSRAGARAAQSVRAMTPPD